MSLAEIIKGIKIKNTSRNVLPCTVTGTAKAAAACIRILKFDESRNSCRRIPKTNGALQTGKENKNASIVINVYIKDIADKKEKSKGGGLRINLTP